MSEKKFKTSIGGQALIEGIMMRGPVISAMAVRNPEKEIVVETFENTTPKWYHKTPFLRGIFNMVSSLSVGYKTLMRSAEIAGQAEEMEPSKFEKWLAKTFKVDIMNVITVMAVLIGGLLAIGLFAALPTFIAGLFKDWIGNGVLRSLVEGVLKIALFVGYLALVMLMPDIRRTFEYHGAEHKTIACYEAGLELTVDNVKPQSRFHPRCGTSFLLIVLVVSILVFSVVHVDHFVARFVLKVLLIPLVVGIAYEIIRLAGRYDNIITRAVSAPGMWLQRLTTKEPDDSQIEVAIASMKPVLPKEKGTDGW